jgi:hypothetical protein
MLCFTKTYLLTLLFREKNHVQNVNHNQQGL